MKPWALIQIVAVSLLSIDTVVIAVPVPATTNSVPSIGSPHSLSSRSLFFNPDVALEVRGVAGEGPSQGGSSWSSQKAKSWTEARVETEMKQMIKDAREHPDKVIAYLNRYIGDPNGIIPLWKLSNGFKNSRTETIVAPVRQWTYGALEVVLDGCKELAAMTDLDPKITTLAHRVIEGISDLKTFQFDDKGGSSPPSGSSA